MSALEFPEFMKRFQLQLLGVSVSDIVPGAVLDKARRGFQYQGHLREILTDTPASFWKTELNAANIVYGAVERTVNLAGKADLDEMGVRIGGGLKLARAATFSLTKVSARTFRNGPAYASKFSVLPRVTAVKKTDRARWKMINGKWIVFETYHAVEATIHFDADAGMNIQAEVEAAGGVTVSGHGAVNWTSKRSFVIAGNDAVPFAFRGWQL